MSARRFERWTRTHRIDPPCDRLIAAYLPRDCERADCGEWTPSEPRAFRHLFIEPDAPVH
jgi:hypothetical protein